MYIAIFADSVVFKALKNALVGDGAVIAGFPVDTQLEYGLERGNIIVCDLTSFLPAEADADSTVKAAIEIAKRLIDCPSPPSRMVFTIQYSGDVNDYFKDTMRLFSEWAVNEDFKEWQYSFAVRPCIQASDNNFCFDNGLFNCPWNAKDECIFHKIPWCNMVECLRQKILVEPTNVFGN